MIKEFISYQVKGRGRARTLGFPTINLEIPRDFDLKTGIYGVWIYLDGKKYLGAMQYGDSPTFDDKTKSLEVFLIDLKKDVVIDGKNIKVEVEKYIRQVKKFISKDRLIKQIEEDVKEINKLT